MPQTVQCISGVLQPAQRTSPGRIISCLFAVAMTARPHPRLKDMLRTSPHRDILLHVFQAAVADRNIYNRDISVSQLAVSQYNLRLLCPEFWDRILEESSVSSHGMNRQRRMLCMLMAS